MFFALFIFSGAINREKEAGYVKIYNGANLKKLKRGVVVKKFAIEKSATVKKLLSILDVDAINEVDLYDGEKKIYTLSQEKIKKLIEEGDIQVSVGRRLGL